MFVLCKREKGRMGCLATETCRQTGTGRELSLIEEKKVYGSVGKDLAALDLSQSAGTSPSCR